MLTTFLIYLFIFISGAEASDLKCALEFELPLQRPSRLALSRDRAYPESASRYFIVPADKKLTQSDLSTMLDPNMFPAFESSAVLNIWSPEPNTPARNAIGQSTIFWQLAVDGNVYSGHLNKGKMQGSRHELSPVMLLRPGLAIEFGLKKTDAKAMAAFIFQSLSDANTAIREQRESGLPENAYSGHILQFLINFFRIHMSLELMAHMGQSRESSSFDGNLSSFSLLLSDFIVSRAVEVSRRPRFGLETEVLGPALNRRIFLIKSAEEGVTELSDLTSFLAFIDQYDRVSGAHNRPPRPPFFVEALNAFNGLTEPLPHPNARYPNSPRP